jgi:hypothetical protein
MLDADAKIVAAHSIQRTFGRPETRVAIPAGELYLFFKGKVERAGFMPLLVRGSAVELFAQEGWEYDAGFSLCRSEYSIVDDDLDAQLRALVALTGELPLNPDALLSEVTNDA